MRKKFLLMMLTLLFVAMGSGGNLFAQELLVNCDYNSSTEGWGTTKFSNYDGAYAYATANRKTSATIVIEKTNTISGNCFNNNHKDYSKLAVVIEDGATMGNANSKWDMTYPVTVKPGGTLTCARPKNSSVGYIHIKNTLTVGEKGSDKKAHVNFLSDSYQDCDISIRYNGKILVYNADFAVQDLDAQGTLTIEDSDVTVDGAFASTTLSSYPTTLTNSTVTINGTQISGGLSDFAGGTSNQLGNVKINNSTLTIKEGDTKVAANVTATNSDITVNNLTVNSGKTLNLKQGSTLDAENITVNGTGSVKIDDVAVPIIDGAMYVPVSGFAALKAAVEAGKNVQLTANITTTSAIVTSGVTSVIDLNDKTLTIGVGDNKFKAKSNVTIKNGDVKIDGVTVQGNAIFCLDEYEKTLVSTLTFDEVNLTGENYSSAYGVFYIGESSVLNVKDGEWNLKNDKFEAGGVFKADASGAKLNIDGLNLTAHNVRRVVTYANTTIENSTMTISGDAEGVDAEMEHGFNRSPLAISNSTITMKDMYGRGITAQNGAVTISDNSNVNITNCIEATIDVRNNQTVTIDNTSTVFVDKEPTLANGCTINGTVKLPTVAKIGAEEYSYLADALNAAKSMTGDVTVEICAKVTMNQALTGSYSSIKFVGPQTRNNTEAEIYLDVQGYIEAPGKQVAFENLTLSKSAGGFINNAGFMNVAFGVYNVNEVTYKNCTFANGSYASSGKVTYTDCTFNRSHDKYGLWAYGNVEAIVDRCTFADYRGIKMYAENGADASTIKPNLTVKSTDFLAVDNKPAIVLTYGESVVLENNDYSSTGTFELDLDGKPNGVAVTSDVAPVCVNDNGACGVLVDGKIYTTVAQAAEVATSGSTVKLLHDSAETVELPFGVILENNGFDANGVTVAPAVAKSYKANGELVAEYGDFESAIAAATTNAEISRIEVLDNYEQKSVTNTENYYDVTQALTIGVEEGENYTVKGCSFAVRVQNAATLTIEEGLTIEGLDVVANGFATQGENMTINGTLKALSLKQWTSNGTITVNGKVELGYGDGQFDMAYGNGNVIVTGNGNKTEAQFKAGYSGTRGNGGVLTLKDTYFEAGSWFTVAGSNTTINVNNSLLKVSGGDAAGSLTLGETNVININLGSTIQSSTISGNGTINIDATGITENVTIIKGNMSDFAGTINVTNNAVYEKTTEGLVVKSTASVKKSGTWGGIDWSLTYDGTLTIAPTAGEPVPDKNAPTKRTYEVGEWRETVIYKSNGSASAIGGAPYDMNAVKKLIIKEGVTKIGSFTCQFPNLTGEVVIPSTVTYFGQETFHKTPITKLTFAAGGTEQLCIANGAFKKTLIEEVSFPGDREDIHIHHWAFGGSPKLKTAYIPANVTKCWGGEHVDYFDNYDSQTNPSWTYISSIFTGCTDMQTITFENEAARDNFFGSNRNSTAEDPMVAYAGLTAYNTFDEALEAALENGNTLGLAKNVTVIETIEVPGGKTLAFNLNGKTISQSKACTASYEMINNKGNLTITGNGKISFTDTGAGDPNFGWGSYTINNSGNLTVEKATIEHKGAQAFATHMICAIFQYSGSTTIEGGTISTPNYRSARLWKGDMTINGGTFDGQVWVQAVDNSAKLTINGGTFEPNGNDASSVFVENKTYDVEFAVTDGTFNGKVGCSDATKLAGAITGGKFTEKAVANTNKALLAEGLVFSSQVVDGYCAVSPETEFVATVGGVGYMTFEEAFEAAKTGETIETIELFADVEATSVFLIDKSLTINGNGHKVTSSATRVFRVTVKDTEVTLNNVNMVNTAVRVGQNDIRGISVDDVTGVKLTLNNCSVDFTDASACDWSYAVNVVGGSGHYINVNGGTYEGANVINVRGAGQTVLVKDATLTSLYPNNDQYYGACIYVVQDLNSSVDATGNTFNGSNAVAFNVGYTPVSESNNTDNTTICVAKIGNTYYTSLKEAFAAVGVGNGKTVELIRDVDLASAEWTPVNFNGVFDGQNHTISNLVINGDSNSNQGFFAQTENGEIKNVTFNNAKVSGYLNVGVVAGTPYTSKYTNVKVKGHVEVNGYAYVGGVGGKNAYADWTDITVDVDPTSYVKADSENYRTYVGGVVGFNGEGGHTFENISSNIKVIGSTCDIGGVFGIAHYGNKFKNITFTGSVEAPEGAEEVGGIAGVWHNAKGYTVTFTDCTSTGTVTIGEETTTGSIVGGAYNAINETSENSGSLIIDGKEAWLKVAEVNGVKYLTLAEAATAAKSGDTIIILDNLTIGSSSLTLPAGITLDGNGKTIDGGITAGGDLTFVGHTKVSTFSAGYYDRTITIGEDACLEVTGGLMTVSYGNTINVTGSIDEAKSANKAEITPSLIIEQGLSFNGDGRGVEFNITNAYVKLGDSSSKNSGATGKFNFNFVNSIVDFTKTLKTYEPTKEGLDPSFEINVENSVVSFASHLELWNTNTTLTLNNSNLTVGSSFANAGTINVTNGANFFVNAPIMSSHGGNTGTINIKGGVFELNDSNQDWENAGTIKVNAVGGKLITNDFKCVGEGKIVVDAENLIGTVTVVDGNGGYNFANITEIINGESVNVSYENGDVTVTKVLATIGENEYQDLQDAINAAGTTETIITIMASFSASFSTDDSYTIAAGQNITLDLNGKTITGTDNATGSFGLINNKGTLKIVDNNRAGGAITLKANVNRGWNAYSSVISNQPGGKLIVENGTIEHLGGTDMAYAIDNLTNGKGTYAETEINGGTVKSPYRAIRQFLNGVEAQNILTVNGGTIEGANKSIWMQDPSKNANTGTLIVNENANLYGDVYLSVTEGSTEWPVEVTIVADALKDGSTVLTSNVPEGYLLVFENGLYTVETIGVKEQTFNLNNGWTWVSLCVDATAQEDLTSFEEQLAQYNTDKQIVQIKSQTQAATYQEYYGTYGWYGNLKSLAVNGMYMVKIEKDNVVVTLEDYKVNPADYEFNLVSGWTWLGFPSTSDAPVAIEYALQNITPNKGDQIKSQEGFATYTNNKWYGNLSSMTPGVGYMYKNNSDNTVTLKYPAEVNYRGVAPANITAKNNLMVPNMSKYANNMSIIAVVNIDGEELMTEDFEVAVFAGEELRGSARPIYVEDFNSYMLFLTVYGEANEELTFKYYDLNSGEELNLFADSKVVFEINATVGSIEEALVLNYGTLSIDENSLNGFNVYPNPVNRENAISFETTFDKVEVYNSLGVVVAEYANVDKIDGIETAGIYVIKVTNDNTVKYCRVIVK